MNNRFLFFLTIYLISKNLYANTSYRISPEVDTAIVDSFKQNPNAVQAVSDRFYYMKIQQLVNKDDAKWESNRKKYWESLYCSQFVLGASQEAAEKIEKIKALFLKMDGMQTYDSDEMNKLMSNRELRRRSFKDFDGIENKDKYKYCSFKLTEDFIRQRQKEFTQKDSVALDGALKFEFIHPKLRPSVQKLLKDFSQGKEPTRKSYDDAMAAFLTQVMPILQTKASLEFLPKVEEKCPGFIEKVWQKCKGNKLYPEMMFPSLAKELCFEDHQSEAPDACKRIN